MGSDTHTHTHIHTQVPMCMILLQIMHVRSKSLKNVEKENLHNFTQREAQHGIKKACECPRRMDKIYT